jgi:hypothetical protein
MRKIGFIILTIALFVFMTSCHIMYVPNTQNVPLLEEKNDLKLEIGTKDLQVAYGITDHVGLMVNGYYNKNDWSVTSGTFDNQYLSKRSLIEGGLGYYSALGENGRFEVYGGGGFGHVNYDYNLFDNEVQTESNTFGINFMRFYIQPAIGVQGKSFGMAFSTRLASLSFSNTLSEGYTINELTDEGLNELEDNMFFFVEPALTMRLGVKYVQFEIQPYYNMQVSGPSSINARKYGCNFGVYLSIDEFFRM